MFGSKWAILINSQQPFPTPSCPKTPPPLRTATAYHHLVVSSTHGFTGVFHNTSLDLNHRQSTLRKLRYIFASSFYMTFAYLFAIPFCPKICSSFDVNWNLSLSLFFNSLFSVTLSALTLCQIYASYFCQRNSHLFYLPEKLWMLLWGREGQEGWEDKQFTALISITEPEQIPLHLLCLKLLEVAGIQIKIIRMILTVLIWCAANFSFAQLAKRKSLGRSKPATNS